MTLQEEVLTNLRGIGESWRLSLFQAGSDSSGFVRELEELAKEYFNIKYAIALSSATAGLHCACVALDVVFVAVPTVTFSATASSVLMAGGRVLFRDIEPDTYCIQPTKASTIIPVHLHGHPADLDSLKGEIIEDCAQAIGAEYKGKKVGTIGNCGVFSFNQNKQIQCGEGGMLITNDEELARKVRLMSNHGEVCSDILGYNYRMTELQAAFLIPQFKRLDQIISERIELAEYLTDKLKDIEGLAPPIVRDGCKHSYCTYPVKVDGHINRDELQAGLFKKGVYFGKGGYKPLHLFEFYGGREGQFPIAEECYKTVMYTNTIKPPMTFKDMDKIAEAFKKCLNTIAV